MTMFLKVRRHLRFAPLLSIILAASVKPAAANIALVDTAAEAGLSMSITECGQSSVTITNFTVSPMADVLVVLVEDKGASAVNSEPATLVWGSQTIVKAVAQDNPNTNLRGESIYYLFNPMPGTNNITAAVANNPLNVEMTAYTLSGVDTSVPPKTGCGGNIGTGVTFGVPGVVAGSWAAFNSTWSAQSPVPTISGTGGTSTMTSFLMVDNQSTILTAGYISGLSAGSDIFAAAWSNGTQKNNFAVAVFTPLATAINITATSASPTPVTAGASVLLSVTASSTAGTITNVVVNATPIGGLSALPLNSAGTNMYTNSVTATIPTLGAILPVTIQDSAGNVLMGSVRVVVETVADMQFDAYNNAYLIQIQSNNGLAYYANSLSNRSSDSGWTFAIDIEGAEDAYERTHSPVQQQLVNSLCTDWLLQSPMPWSGDSWNDDIGWFSLVLVRGYQMTGDINYLNAAEYGFNLAFTRGWDTNYNNGGIWEQQPADVSGAPNKNPLSNDSNLQTVCMLYQSTSNALYLSYAEQIYSWVRTNLFNTNTGQIYGDIATNGVPDTSADLYNQGTFVDCANLLWQITGQQVYYNDAILAVEYTRNHLTDNGIFNNNATYMYTWAAEFGRGLGHFVKDNNLWSRYYPWMQANANAAWACRRPDYNVSWSEWTEPTPTTNDLSVGWAVNAVAMTQATPASEPGLVNCTNKLTGAIIGTSGSWSNDGDTILNVFDCNLNTFFDGPDATGDWVGLDFGSGATKVIGQINYWPRNGFSERMLGGVFQGANNSSFNNPVTLFVIASAPPEDDVVTPQTITNTNTFRYVRYLGPTDGYCNVAEIQFLSPNPPSAPANLMTSVSNTQINLSWTRSGATNWAITYVIQRGTNNGGPYTTIATGVTPTNYTDAGATPGITYYYAVVAVNGGGTSADSAQSSTVIPIPYINYTWDGTNLTLNWSGGGLLLQATNVTGPWTTNAGAASPFVATPEGPQMFYQIQMQ